MFSTLSSFPPTPRITSSRDSMWVSQIQDDIAKVANLESRVGDLEEENAALRRRMEHMA